jgi:hypothetical protein
MPPRPPKKQAAYKLPIDLIRAIKRRAAEEERWPASVVAAACREYLARARDEDRQPVTVAS